MDRLKLRERPIVRNVFVAGSLLLASSCNADVIPPADTSESHEATLENPTVPEIQVELTPPVEVYDEQISRSTTTLKPVVGTTTTTTTFPTAEVPLESAVPTVEQTYIPLKVFNLFQPQRAFGDEYYAYAASTVVEEDKTSTFYCTNAESGQITDSIYAHVTDAISGVSTDSLVLSASDNRELWDSRHVCDPSVVRGEFSYGVTNYEYAMFYTGSKDPKSNGTQNEIGVALSNDQKNWTKYPLPVVPRYADSWGVGQPSAISVDGKGKILLFYSRDDVHPTGQYETFAQLFDMSDVSSIQRLIREWRVPTAGLETPKYDDTNVLLHNADFGYDTVTDMFFAIHPSRYDFADPTFVAAEEQLVSISASDLWAGTGLWKIIDTIDSRDSEHARNHNAALAKTAYGTLANSSAVQIIFTCSDEAEWPDFLWSYRLCQTDIPIK
jgi:hypothetical protein